jgi:hypothetical protein
MPFRVKLHATPKVKNYLESQYGELVVLERKNPIHRFILEQLSKSPHRFDKRIDVQKTYKEEIQMTVSEDIFFRQGHSFTPTATSLINTHINQLINRELFIALDVALNTNYKETRIIRKAILSYCDRLGLDPEIFKYDSLKRAYLRERKARKTSLKIPIKTFGTTVPRIEQLSVL